MKRNIPETLESRYEKAVFDRMRYLNLYRNNDQDGYPGHWHSTNEIEFIMPILRHCLVVCNGKKFTLQENEILIIPHGCVHRILPMEEYGEQIIFMADLGLLYQFREYRSLFAFQLLPVKIDSTMLKLQKKLNVIIRQLEQEYYGENKMRTSAIYALVIQMFVAIAREMVRISGENTEVEFLPEQLAAVMEYMEKHLAEDLNINNLAQRFGYCEEELARLMKKYTGRSFFKYLEIIRINRAEELLSEYREIGIKEIGKKCGFSSYTTFIRRFKKAKGCNPSEYRKSRY